MAIPKPYAHQKQSVDFKRDHPATLDWSDCGVGKTRTEIDVFAQYGSGKCLVLAPKSILEPAWLEDIKSFAPHLRASVAYAENRAEAFKRDADIYITNHDAVKWLAQQSPKFWDGYTEMKLDEASCAKHRTSLRSKGLNKIKKYFKKRRQMTATPNGNTITDLWNQAFIADDGRRLGQNFGYFRSQVCIPTQTGPSSQHLEWKDRDGAEVAVCGLLADITIRHELEKCTDIPPNHLYTRPVILSARHRALYNKLEKDSILQLNGATITAVNGAVLASKLLQAASGAVYGTDDETGEGTYTTIETGRYQLTLDLVEEARQSVVFFQWKHQKDELVKEAEKRGLSFSVLDGSITNIHERNRLVKDFQTGAYRVIFIHPQTGAHGLTLTRAVRTIWPSPTYHQELFHQGIKRIHRAGQREVTETIVLVAPGTYDEIAYASCTGKRLRMFGLLDLMAA